MNKQVKNPFKKAGQGGNKRFLINAAILAAGCLLVIFRMQTWGIAQVIVLALFEMCIRDSRIGVGGIWSAASADKNAVNPD